MSRRLIAASMAVALIATFSTQARAQVGGNGTLKGWAYFDLTKGLSDTNDDVLTYRFRRIYFTYDMQFSDDIKGRFRTDVSQMADGKYTPFMKHAYVDWRSSDMLSLRFGQQGTLLFGDIEGVWGYRAVAKTMQDQFKVRSSADFGMSGAFTLTDMITVKAMFSNGNGYNKKDDDTYGKAYEVQGLFTPINGLLVTAHYGINGFDPDNDTSTDNNENTTTMDLSVGYTGEGLAVGGSYTTQSNFSFTDGVNGSGYWVFGRYSLSDSPISFMATYQSWDPDTDTDDDTMTKLLAGVDFTPGKGLSIIPNFVQTKSGNDDAVNSVNLTFYWKW